MLKGLVWSSSDEEVVSVDENGNVTGLKAGKAVVSVSNAAGVYAECTVTVAADEPADDISVALLEYAIELAGKVNMDGVVDAVKENFDNALQTAKDVLARVQSGDPTVTQNEVDSAWRNLIKAIQYGEFKAGDKTELEKVIVLAEQMYSQLDKYLEAGKAEFVAALDNAKDVYADGNAFQEDVDSAWKQLMDAMANLRLIPNKDLLEDLINQAESLDKEDYEEAGFDAMLDALEDAKAVFGDADATQDEVDAAAESLKAALGSLVASNDGAAQGSSNQSTTTSSNTSAAKATKTGDTVNVFPIAAGMVLAAGAAAAAVTVRRKKK